MTGKTIDFYFDFSSPYSYFPAFQIDELGKRFDREVIWKPMMLGAAFKETGNKPLTEQPLKGDYCKADWDRMSRYLKLPWAMPEPFPVATLAAARAFYWIWDGNRDQAREFGRAVFRGYFGEGKDITDKSVVLDMAAAAGADRAGVAAGIDGADYKQRLKDETAAAVARGVFGAPFFFVDDEPFWGSDRLWMIKHWLMDGGW